MREVFIVVEGMSQEYKRAVYDYLDTLCEENNWKEGGHNIEARLKKATLLGIESEGFLGISQERVEGGEWHAGFTQITLLNED